MTVICDLVFGPRSSADQNAIGNRPERWDAHLARTVISIVPRAWMRIWPENLVEALVAPSLNPGGLDEVLTVGSVESEFRRLRVEPGDVRPSPASVRSLDLGSRLTGCRPEASESRPTMRPGKDPSDATSPFSKPHNARRHRKSAPKESARYGRLEDVRKLRSRRRVPAGFVYRCILLHIHTPGWHARCLETKILSN